VSHKLKQSYILLAWKIEKFSLCPLLISQKKSKRDFFGKQRSSHLYFNEYMVNSWALILAGSESALRVNLKMRWFFKQFFAKICQNLTEKLANWTEHKIKLTLKFWRFGFLLGGLLISTFFSCFLFRVS